MHFVITISRDRAASGYGIDRPADEISRYELLLSSHYVKADPEIIQVVAVILIAVATPY